MAPGLGKMRRKTVRRAKGLHQPIEADIVVLWLQQKVSKSDTYAMYLLVCLASLFCLATCPCSSSLLGFVSCTCILLGFLP